MASNFNWQEIYCPGCLSSDSFLCQECQTILDQIISFDEITDTAVEAPGQTGFQTDDLGESPFSHNSFPTWQSQETISSAASSFESSHGSHTGLSGIESTTAATASEPRYYPDDLEPRWLVSTPGGSADLPYTDPTYSIVPDQTYQAQSLPSPAVNISPTQVHSPHADQSRSFRCDRPSRQSPATICGQPFKQAKDLDRHVRSVHALGDDATYRCSCPYKTARKDNYKRHLGRCDGGIYQLHIYTCICGLTNTQKTDHEAHLGLCRVRR